jgi:hypothetical protein
MTGGRKALQNIDWRIFARFHGRGRGRLFVPSNFIDLGSREAVDLA